MGRLKIAGSILAFVFMQAIALVAVFAALQVIAPSLAEFRRYVDADLPNLLLALGVGVGVTYICNNL